MAVCNIEDLKDNLPQGKQILGLDVGSKTIGLSISTSNLSLATPITTLKRRKFSQDLQQLKLILTERNIGALVIGLPLNMDGSEGRKCQSVRQFGRNILKEIDIPIVYWDERLSTYAMEQEMLAHDVSRKKRTQAIDALAATHILQGALEKLAP